MKSRLVCLALVATVVVDVFLFAASPSSAAPESDTHTGNGVLVVEAGHPIGPSQIHYVIRLTWADGHPADMSYVTATLVDLSGTAVPVALYPYDSDGRYAGTITFPGSGVWTVRFSSALPAVTVDHTEIRYQNLLAELLAPPKAA